MSHRVYISYAAKDKGIAESIAKQVRDSGATLVGAEGIPPGALIQPRISEAIRQSDEIMLLVTKNSAQSAWLNYEVGAAFALGKQVTPILFHINSSELPPVLRSVQAIKFENLDSYVRQRSSSGQSVQHRLRSSSGR